MKIVQTELDEEEASEKHDRYIVRIMHLSLTIKRGFACAFMLGLYFIFLSKQ